MNILSANFYCCHKLNAPVFSSHKNVEEMKRKIDMIRNQNKTHLLFFPETILTLPPFMEVGQQQRKFTNEELTELSQYGAKLIDRKDYEYMVSRCIPLTFFDDNFDINTRCQNLQKQDNHMDTFSFETQRKIIFKSECDKMKDFPAEKKLIIITGISGAGKSTFVKKSKFRTKYYCPDADLIKRQFREYSNEKGIDDIHKNSVRILEEDIIPGALSKDINLVVQTTGWHSYVTKIARMAKQKGYHVKLIHISTNLENAIYRSKKRFKETGSFIDPYTIIGMNNSYIYQNHLSNAPLNGLPDFFAKVPYVNKIQVYDNNGSEPFLTTHYFSKK